ncbi:MAG: T9SS type A sorting domain-containing protein, partial [Bacteroidota bacterium]|nr:T9SS type A sorting domain-containing protein [Bacteroidota bacterium]
FINPAAQDNIVIGTDLGIFESDNNGGTWAQSNNGLANVAVVDLDFRSSDKKLFAATHGRGMFVTSIVTGINDGKLSEMKYQLNQNYPNPFNPETQITYTLPEQNKVTLTIYDSNGKRVAELVNGQQAAGNYNIKWNANKVSSGVYFYQLKAGDMNIVKKMVLLK